MKDWLRELRGNTEREPLFVRLPVYLAVTGAIGFALAAQWHQWFGGHKQFLYITAVTLVTTYIWGTFGLLVWELVQLFPIRIATLARDLSAFAITGALLLWLQQIRFYLWGGFGSPLAELGYGENAVYFFRHEGVFYVLIYVAMVLLLRGLYAHRCMQRMQLQSTQMQQELTKLELLNLRARLQPHFLFNALNTISAFIRQDPNKADEMIELLSGWMRRNLEYAENETTPLTEEMCAAREYLELQQMRFHSRLRFQIDTAPATRAMMVPSRILQPVVENCIKHAVESSLAVTDVRISSELRGDELILTVENTRGESVHRGFGSGLKWVEKRLRILYGDAARLQAGAVGADYRVRLSMPALNSSNGQY